jgi:fumarylacetoacetase
MSSWVPGAAGSGYDVDHLPYGVFVTAGAPARVGVRVGGFVLDLAPLTAMHQLERAEVFRADSLNPFLDAGFAVWQRTRTWLGELLTQQEHRDTVEPFLLPVEDVSPRLPLVVGDYVDFYCSEHHATNVGRIFRPDGEPLQRNWRHLPVGYHGRSGSIVVSGTDVVRPCGQRLESDDSVGFGATRRLDLEAELGFVVGGSPTAQPVPPADLAERVLGVLLLNDWSARDIQAFETVPLGPFLGKSFATSVAAWVTPLAALADARVQLPRQIPEPQPYLQVAQPAGYDVDLEVWVNDTLVATPPYASTYWSPAQMLAHLTVNGASLRPGDLFASGTVSGPARHQRGSMLELSWGGTEPFAMADGGTRTFLEDGDQVTLTASAPGALGGRLRLGEVRGRVLPALDGR